MSADKNNTHEDKINDHHPDIENNSSTPPLKEQQKETSIINNGKEDYHDYESFTMLDMVKRQLSIFRLRKNLDPTWKQQAKDTVPISILIFYVASSFFFTAAGIIMLVKESTLSNAFSSYPWYAFGAYLIVQGVVTHFADTVYVDRSSIWHPVDRLCAWVGLLFILSSFVFILVDSNGRQNHLGGIIVYGLGIIFSVAVFVLEWKSKAKGDITWFVLCHALWHMFWPLGLVVLILTL